MRSVSAAFCLLALGVSPALAQRAPEIVIPGRPGVPILMNGVDISWSVIEGDFGLDRPGEMTPRVIYRPFAVSVPYYGFVYGAPGYFPRSGRRPGYGRLEIVPPRNRRLPQPAPTYYRSWSSDSAPGPVTEYPPYTPSSGYGMPGGAMGGGRSGGMGNGGMGYGGMANQGQQPGHGQGALSGQGANAPAGPGMNAHPGPGGNVPPGPGANGSPGTGGNVPPGPGANASPGSYEAGEQPRGEAFPQRQSEGFSQAPSRSYSPAGAPAWRGGGGHGRR